MKEVGFANDWFPLNWISTYSHVKNVNFPAETDILATLDENVAVWEETDSWFKVSIIGRAKVLTDRWIHSQVAIAALLWFNSLGGVERQTYK